MSRTIYIAGPMRAYDQFNFPAFDAAEMALSHDGWAVLSPARHDRECGFDETLNSLDGFDMGKAARWDIEAILSADAVFMLDGWEASTGATLEYQIAQWLGLQIFYQTPAADEKPSGGELLLSVAEEAHGLVHGPRQGAYGHPADDFTRTGRIWGAILGQPDIAPELVGLCMAGVKISREVNHHGRDNLTDLCGYALTVALVHERYEETSI